MLFGKYINKYYKKYWYLFILVFLSDAFVDFIQLLIPVVIGRIISKIEAGTFILYAENGNILESDLFVSLIAISVIAVLIVLGRMGWRYSSSHIGAKIERDLRKEMYDHIQLMSVDYFNSKKVGGLLSYFTNDLQTIKTLFSEGLIWLTDLIVLGILAFTMMFIMSWRITLISAIPLLIFIFLGSFFFHKESEKYRLANDSFEELSDFTEETFQGLNVIKAFRKEDTKKGRFSVLVDDNQNKSINYLRYSSLIDAGINLFITFTYAIMIFLLSFAIIQSNQDFAPNIRDVGDLTTFSGFYSSLIWPMIAGGLLIDYMSRARGAYKRIATILSSKVDIVDKKGAVVASDIKGDIVFNNFTFAYSDSSKPVLENISFKIKAGQTIGIVGKTGSGKTTLVNSLPKMFNIDQGELFIDGIDITDWSKQSLKEHIGIVSQEAFLFSGPIKYAVAFSESDPHKCDLDKVKEACSFACVSKDIQEFPNGYDTILGEKGTTVSGGQRQRLSIARAIYKNPSILILDDSLSAVDADTEKKILANIKEYRKNKTTIIIASRISAIEDADLIVVLSEGKIVGLGDDSELKKSCSLYQKLVYLQSLEKEIL